MPGSKTSVYLSEELATAVRTSGEPLAEIIRRGLRRTHLNASAVPAVHVPPDDLAEALQDLTEQYVTLSGLRSQVESAASAIAYGDDGDETLRTLMTQAEAAIAKVAASLGMKRRIAAECIEGDDYAEAGHLLRPWLCRVARRRRHQSMSPDELVALGTARLEQRRRERETAGS